MHATPDAGPYSDPTGSRTALMMEKYAAPESVLDAPITALTDRPKLRAAYADDARLYPIHTPAAAWVSAAYYHDAGPADAKVAAELRDALLRHRLWDEWERLAESADMNRRVKAAADAPTRFALPEARKYPIDTPENVDRAAAYFYKYANEFSPTDRRTFAESLVGAGRTEWRIEAEAGLGLLAPNWRTAVETRAKLAKEAPDLAAALEKAAAAPPTDPLELVGVLRDLDREVGWDLPDPLTEVIGDTPSSAAAKLAHVCRSAGGRWYRAEDVRAVPESTIAAAVTGSAVAVTSYSKRAAMLEDPVTAAAFEAVLADMGYAPVSREIEHPDWVTLASS